MSKRSLSPQAEAQGTEPPTDADAIHTASVLDDDGRRVVVYARYPTVRQRMDSISRQRAVIEAYCKEHGVGIVEDGEPLFEIDEPVSKYVDW